VHVLPDQMFREPWSVKVYARFMITHKRQPWVPSRCFDSCISGVRYHRATITMEDCFSAWCHHLNYCHARYLPQMGGQVWKRPVKNRQVLLRFVYYRCKWISCCAFQALLNIRKLRSLFDNSLACRSREPTNHHIRDRRAWGMIGHLINDSDPIVNCWRTLMDGHCSSTEYCTSHHTIPEPVTSSIEYLLYTSIVVYAFSSCHPIVPWDADLALKRFYSVGWHSSSQCTKIPENHRDI
jgi:hypothetical protein